MNRERRALRLPVSTSHWMVLEGMYPMPESEWARMIDILTKMRYALVIPDDAMLGGEEGQPVTAASASNADAASEALASQDREGMGTRS